MFRTQNMFVLLRCVCWMCVPTMCVCIHMDMRVKPICACQKVCALVLFQAKSTVMLHPRRPPPKVAEEGGRIQQPGLLTKA